MDGTDKIEDKEATGAAKTEDPPVQHESINAAIDSFSHQFVAAVERFEASNQAEQRERRNYEINELKWTKIAACAGITFSVMRVVLSGLTLGVLYRTYGVYQGQATVMATQAATMQQQTDITRNTLPIVRDQAIAAINANNIAQKSLEWSERPWLKVNVQINGPITFDKKQGSIPLLFQIINVGKSPASNVDIDPEIFGLERGHFNLFALSNEKCAPYRQGARRGLGETIFPNQPFNQLMTYDIQGEQLAKIQREKTAKLWLAGCVGYSFGDIGYGTGFLYDIWRFDPVQRKPLLSPGISTIGKPISVLGPDYPQSQTAQ